jgi:outer membrane protein OmpA-like peptidoglycan-associated protein
MSAVQNRKHALGLAVVLAAATLGSGCVGETVRGEVTGTNTQLQRVIAKGSKNIKCAPKATALAEANVRFAEQALDMGEYYRGKEHARLAKLYTQLADAKTDETLCRAPGQVVDAPQGVVGDRDGDGYDDEADGCPDNPEDFDGFEDEDGCPDEDNDKDGVFDAARFEGGKWVNLDTKDGKDCRDEPEDKDGFEDEDGCPDPDNDKDGILDPDDQCPNKPEDLDNFQDEDGCPEDDNDQDGLKDPQDQCPNQPEDMDGDADEDGCPDLAAKWDGCALQLDDKVYFEFNKWDIDPRSYSLLDDVATALNDGPAADKVTIEIGGHTDSKGSDKYNQKLSQKRVDSVRTYLVNKGVASGRMTAVGYGEKMPIDSNRTSEGRARNRRVEFNRTDGECKK